MALKILSVDDSKMIRTIIKKTLAPYSVEIAEAEDGVKGLELATSFHPDLIVLDVAMPVMNGIEMLSKLKGDARMKTIPVIMLTAESGKEKVMQIIQLGASGYILKPFKGEELLDRIKKLFTLEEKKAGPGAKYFKLEGEHCVVTLPDKVTRPVLVEVEQCIDEQISALAEAKCRKLVLDLINTVEVSVSLVKLIVLLNQKCDPAKIGIAIAGSPVISKGLKDMEETRDIVTHFSLSNAKTALA